MSDDLSGFSMMDLFRMEAEERLTVLSQGLVALEGPGRRPQVIEPLMRAAHSLKGAARIVGLDAAVRVAHAMEDCLVAAQKGELSASAGAHRHAAARGRPAGRRSRRSPEGELEALADGAWRGGRRAGDRPRRRPGGRSTVGDTAPWPSPPLQRPNQLEPAMPRPQPVASAFLAGAPAEAEPAQQPSASPKASPSPGPARPSPPTASCE